MTETDSRDDCLDPEARWQLSFTLTTNAQSAEP
jgi:hypothetical protein